MTQSGDQPNSDLLSVAEMLHKAEIKEHTVGIESYYLVVTDQARQPLLDNHYSAPYLSVPRSTS